MARYNREFHALLDDAEKLQLYAQSAVSKHQALDTSLAKAKSRSKHWEREAKASAKKIAGAKKERDKAKNEAQVASLATVATGDTKARAEDDLARVQEALAIIEKARCKARADFCLWLRMLCSNTTFVETNQRFRMVCLTPPTRFLQISLRTIGALQSCSHYGHDSKGRSGRSDKGA